MPLLGPDGMPKNVGMVLSSTELILRLEDTVQNPGGGGRNRELRFAQIP